MQRGEHGIVITGAIAAICLAVTPHPGGGALFGSKESREYDRLREAGHAAAKQGRFEEAELVLLQALEPAKTAFGEKDGRYVKALRDAVAILRFRGNATRAVPIAEQMVTSAEKRYGKSRREYAAALHEHGQVLLKAGNARRAEEQFRAEEKIARLQQGACSPAVGYCQGGTARALAAQGRNSEALPMFAAALELMGKVRTRLEFRNPGGWDSHVEEQVFQPRFNDVAELTYDLVRALQSSQRLEEAGQVLGKLRASIERQAGRDHPMLTPILIRQAWNDDGRGRLESAERHYLDAVRVSSRAEVPKPVRTNALANLYRFYHNTDRPAEAAQAKTRLNELDFSDSALADFMSRPITGE